jgi:hypothetical protein
MEEYKNLRELVYDDINDEYGYGKYGEFEVIIRKKDGYINITKLCKDGRKEFSEWKRSNFGKKLIEFFKEELGIDIILQTIMGGKNMIIRGTYIHPDLVPHIAYWISPKFAVYISKIINEWKSLSQKNEIEYWTTMGDCVNNYSFDNYKEEHSYRDKIAEEENGEKEVKVESGYIDVLTDTKIIEVKQVDNWKSATGQVLNYSIDLENLGKIREKWIYLFGSVEEDKKRIINFHCVKLGIKVEFL